MKEKLNSKQIKEICKIQHKIYITDIIMSRMPLGYTSDNIGELERDMKIRSINEKCKKQMEELIKKYGGEVIKNTFTDKELMQSEENRFTFEEQRQATKEVIGKELTLEEVFERF